MPCSPIPARLAKARAVARWGGQKIGVSAALGLQHSQSPLDGRSHLLGHERPVPVTASGVGAPRLVGATHPPSLTVPEPLLRTPDQ